MKQIVIPLIPRKLVESVSLECYKTLEYCFKCCLVRELRLHYSRALSGVWVYSALFTWSSVFSYSKNYVSECGVTFEQYCSYICTYIQWPHVYSYVRILGHNEMWLAFEHLLIVRCSSVVRFFITKHILT